MSNKTLDENLMQLQNQVFGEENLRQRSISVQDHAIFSTTQQIQRPLFEQIPAYNPNPQFFASFMSNQQQHSQNNVSPNGAEKPSYDRILQMAQSSSTQPITYSTSSSSSEATGTNASPENGKLPPERSYDLFSHVHPFNTTLANFF